MWYPTWTLRHPGVSHEAPQQAVNDKNTVVALNALAMAAGISVGMKRRAAEALCPTIVTIVRDEVADMARFEPVVEHIESVVPRVEIADPGLVFIPVTGAVSYYGSELALVERLDKELEAFGGDRRMSIAAGPFAAWQAVRTTSEKSPLFVVEDDSVFLADLDIAAIGSDDLAATFRWLGITTLGALAELPHDAVISRFGRQGMNAHRIAQGIGNETLPRDIPQDPAIEAIFDPPIENFEQASFIARNLSQRLISQLAPHGMAPHRVVVTATAADGTERIRTWRSADPFDDHTLADRVRWQLRAWIDGVSAGIRGGIASLRLEPGDLSGSGRQLALEEDVKAVEETERALMEVQAIAGADNVLVAVPQGGRDPGQQVLWSRWGEGPVNEARDIHAPWPGKIPGPAPTLVPPDPVPFPVSWVEGTPEHVRLRSRWVPVLSWAGPWRHVGRWWDGEGSSDRYQIVTPAGAYLCEVRDGHTYLIGVYD
ncbi:MAG: DNA polymerase Y family protein [Acidimicrobiia bacterium]|nr:MAG: DNA polymerase Y family protein [Acidimicrobiia bacterium]